MPDNSHERVNQDAIKRLNEARSKGTHNIILLCDPYNLPAYHRIMINEVFLEPNPDDGDIYKHGLSGKWCLHHQARLKLSMAANVGWDPARTIESSPDYIHIQAIGWITKEYNQVVKWSGDCELDRQGLHNRLLLEQADKADKLIADRKMKPENRENFINDKVTKEEARVWTNRMKLAATASKSVVIDKLLNLRSGYKNPSDLRRPWLIVRCHMAPDLDDPFIKRQLNMMALQAMAGIYGAPAFQQPAIDVPCHPVAALPDASGPASDPGTIDQAQPKADDEPPPPDETPPPEEDPPVIPFAEWPDNEREKEIERLIKQTAYDTSKLSRPWQKVSPQMQQDFYEILLAKAQKQATPN